MLSNTLRFAGKCKHFQGALMCHFHEISTFFATRSLFRIPSDMRNQESSLYRDLCAKIVACGPITVADYMKEALVHPTAGYYTTNNPIGKDADFITSPEISQLFGEMIGVWMVHELSKITGDRFQLVELGPGKGTLCRDILRVFRQLRIIDRVSLHLVEISPALSELQSKSLRVSRTDIASDNSTRHYKEGTTAEGIKVFWYYAVEDVPKGFSIFLAHEFFDALPIHKFQKIDGVWNEVLIDVDPDNANEKKFRYILTRTQTLASKLLVSSDETRDHVEVSPRAIAIVDYLASFLEGFGGFALIVDYGHTGDKSDTFRSFRRHGQHDPLVDPGTADLTADVDFSLIEKIGQKQNRLVSFGPVSQNTFLKKMGMDVRLRMLIKNATDSQKKDLESGYRMLVDEDKMGACFKFFSFFPSVLKDHLAKWPVAGF